MIPQSVEMMCSDSDILARLRAETRVEHAAIEAALGIMDEHLTLELYSRRIVRYYGFYKPLEEKLGDVSWGETLGIDLDARRKTRLLEADLAALGFQQVERFAFCQQLPRLPDLAASFGCLYVLEGATLGGRVMSRHIEAKLGIGDKGGRFFRGYGPKTGEMWSSFCAILRSFPTDPSTEDRMVATAIATFRYFRQWFVEGEQVL
jgi:heme oxygenase